MNWTRTLVLGTITTTAIAVALPARAQQASDAHIRDLIRQATERIAAGQAGQQAPAPTPAGQPAAAARPTVRLTLDEAVKAALDHNLDIAVQRLNPEINDIAYASARAVYKPIFGGTVSSQSLQTVPTNTTNASATGANTIQETQTFNGNLTQSLPWFGGSVVANLNNNKQTTTLSSQLLNPSYNTLWTLQYTQPLLRNFGIDSTRQTLLVTALTRDISDVQLKALITNTLSNVRNAYWDYVFAVQSVDVARQSVDLADQLVQNNEVKVQVGTMAPLDVVQARSQAALARQNLIAAQGTMRTTELALKRLLVAGTEDPLWTATIDPVDRAADFQPEAVDVEAAVRRALSQRTDIEIAKKNVEANDVTLKYLKNQTLPQTDFVVLYGANGVAGTQYKNTGTLNAAREIVSVSGFGSAFNQLFARDVPRWTVALNLSYPLGLSAQQASVARARVQLNQVQAQLKQQELQVATEVTNAAITVQSNSERVQAAQAARDLADQQLKAENSKFEVGMSTNYFVVQAQQQLAAAQNNELQAILNYRKSIVELERLQQTTLQNLNVTVVGR